LAWLAKLRRKSVPKADCRGKIKNKDLNGKSALWRN